MENNTSVASWRKMEHMAIAPKFTIGDEVYFMRYDTPVKKTIKGYAIVYGEFKDLSDKDPVGIVYSFDDFTKANEKAVFASKDLLMEHMFKDL
jgi:hypothetical protein